MRVYLRTEVPELYSRDPSRRKPPIAAHRDPRAANSNSAKVCTALIPQARDAAQQLIALLQLRVRSGCTAALVGAAFHGPLVKLQAAGDVSPHHGESLRKGPWHERDFFRRAQLGQRFAPRAMAHKASVFSAGRTTA